MQGAALWLLVAAVAVIAAFAAVLVWLARAPQLTDAERERLAAERVSESDTRSTASSRNAGKGAARDVTQGTATVGTANPSSATAQSTTGQQNTTGLAGAIGAAPPSTATAAGGATSGAARSAATGPTGTAPVQAPQLPQTPVGAAAADVPKAKPPRKGMTWAVSKSIPEPELVLVGCEGDPRTNTSNGMCDVFNGDMTCNVALPLLCIKKDGQPLPKVPDKLRDEIQLQWSGGTVKLGPAVLGVQLESQAAGNQFCEQEYGAGWRMAEFHDGQGWRLWAKGPLENFTRYWVAVRDKKANCWDEVPDPNK